MIRPDPKYDPLRFVDDAVKRWRPEAFRERPYSAAVEYKVSMMGAGTIAAALTALMLGMAFAGPWRALGFALLVVAVFRVAKPLVRARLYDMEEAKRAAAKPGPEAQGAPAAGADLAANSGDKKNEGPIDTEFKEKK